MTAFLLRFQQPVLQRAEGQPGLHEETVADTVKQFAIVAGTKTVTEVRQEAADEDPRRRFYRALQQQRT